jgi:hypothetical protein
MSFNRINNKRFPFEWVIQVNTKTPKWSNKKILFSDNNFFPIDY